MCVRRRIVYNGKLVYMKENIHDFNVLLAIREFFLAELFISHEQNVKLLILPFVNILLLISFLF